MCDGLPASRQTRIVLHDAVVQVAHSRTAKGLSVVPYAVISDVTLPSPLESVYEVGHASIFPQCLNRTFAITRYR